VPWIAACVQRFNGQPGDPATFDALDALISRQAYRLADWRVASDDVNYRRFFDVNTLAALRMERPEVFEATHQKVLHWLQDGWITALRIDHPDGLSDPRHYFAQLQLRHARQATVAGQEPRALYIAVEKILAEHEQLPESWPVQGDTGYRFASLVNSLFVDSRNEAAMDEAYVGFTGESTSYDEVVYACKKLIIENSLFSELNWLTNALHQIALANRRRTDFTRNRLHVALAEVAAAFPVYRTYLRAGEPASAMDRQHVDWAVAAAKRRLGGAQATVLEYVRHALLGEGDAVETPLELRTRFIARWQQFTAPVMAKAVEDTAFYRYVRLASVNCWAASRAASACPCPRFTRRMPGGNAIGPIPSSPHRRTTASAPRTCARASTCSPKTRRSGARTCSGGPAGPSSTSRKRMERAGPTRTPCGCCSRRLSGFGRAGPWTKPNAIACGSACRRTCSRRCGRPSATPTGRARRRRTKRRSRATSMRCCAPASRTRSRTNWSDSRPASRLLGIGTVFPSSRSR
jgi:hypothetical protein